MQEQSDTEDETETTRGRQAGPGAEGHFEPSAPGGSGCGRPAVRL